MEEERKRRFHCMPNAESSCTGIFFAFWVMPLIIFGIGFYIKRESSEWPLLILPLVIGTIVAIIIRRNIVFAMGRVSVDDDGVEFSVLSIRIARLKWEECHSVLIDFVDTGYKRNSFHILCFSTKPYSRDPKKGVMGLPVPSDGVIIATYNEYLWQDIESYAPKKLIKHADAQRMSIE